MGDMLNGSDIDRNSIENASAGGRPPHHRRLDSRPPDVLQVTTTLRDLSGDVQGRALEEAAMTQILASERLRPSIEWRRSTGSQAFA